MQWVGLLGASKRSKPFRNFQGVGTEETIFDTPRPAWKIAHGLEHRTRHARHWFEGGLRCWSVGFVGFRYWFAGFTGSLIDLAPARCWNVPFGRLSDLVPCPLCSPNFRSSQTLQSSLQEAWRTRPVQKRQYKTTGAMPFALGCSTILTRRLGRIGRRASESS